MKVGQVLLGVFFGAVLLGASGARAAEEEASRPLEGIWRAVAMANEATTVPASRVKGLLFEFSGDKLTMRMADRVLAETELTIDATTEPASIEMVFQGKPTLGIYALEGDDLRICLSGSKEQRPTAFVSEKDSSNRMLIRLRRGEIDPGHPLFVMNADGTGLRQLDMPKGLACGSPDWSPDGKLVACDAWWLSRDEYYANGHVTLVPVDGGELEDLGEGAMPSWSPDGKQIAFCKYSPRGVWVMNADGSEERLIDGAGWGVDWSPVANEIAYTTLSGGKNICIIDPDNPQNSRSLLENEEYATIYWNLSWSPDGKSICFIGVRPNGAKEVARVSTQGEAEGFEVLYSDHEPPRHEAIRTIAAWAGSAEQILVSMKGRDDRHRQLYIIDPEGKKPPQLLPGQASDRDNGDMAWSADGKRVVFVSWEPE